MEKITKKPYKKPLVIHETKLEVRAGSVIPPLPGLEPPLPETLDEQQ